MLPKEITPHILVLIAKRRKWFLIVPFVLSAMCALFLFTVLPRIYRASSLILVQEQSVPQEFVKATVTVDVGQRLRAISQQVMSRTRLEKVAQDLNLYPELRATQPLEVAIDAMRKKINIQIGDSRGGPGSSAFTIGFTDADPRLAARVVNALASFFIEENLKLREAQARGTTAFLETELASLKKQLEAQEEKLKQYKQGHMGELPGQLEANISSLNRMQGELAAVQQSINSTKDRKIVLQRQMAEAEQVQMPVAGMQNYEAFSNTPMAMRLARLQAQLDELGSKYTDRHPDVIRLKSEVERAKVMAKKEADDQAKQAGIGSGQAAGTPLSPRARLISQLRTELESLQLEIRRLESKENELTMSIKSYQARVDDTPKREQELLSLTRDYEITRSNYQSLLNRQVEAKMAENLEKRQQGEQFIVLDPAIPPRIPLSPDLRKLFLFCLGLGIMGGAGLAFALEYMDGSFRSSESLAQSIGLPVLASLPFIPTAEYRRRTFLKRAAATVLSILILGGYAAGMHFVRTNNIKLNFPFF